MAPYHTQVLETNAEAYGWVDWVLRVGFAHWLQHVHTQEAQIDHCQSITQWLATMDPITNKPSAKSMVSWLEGFRHQLDGMFSQDAENAVGAMLLALTDLVTGSGTPRRLSAIAAAFFFQDGSAPERDQAVARLCGDMSWKLNAQESYDAVDAARR